MDAAPFLKLLARQLAKHRIDAVLIGNAAAALQGAPVTTMDFDFMFRATPGNVAKVRRLAAAIGASVTQPYYPASALYRVRRERDDLQLDFMPTISGIRSYEGLRSRASVARFGTHTLHVASLDDVIRSKAAADRPEDRAVLPILRRVVRERDRMYAARKRREA
jgi:hypothetical protein